LFGRIGHLPLLEYGIKQSFEDSEGFSGERRRHSEKPESFFELIRKVSPEPRWEMFARKPHDGFEPWGDAVENA
jgi:N6-adenosine-specific RNA methylase IME4